MATTSWAARTGTTGSSSTPPRPSEEKHGLDPLEELVQLPRPAPEVRLREDQPHPAPQGQHLPRLRNKVLRLAVTRERVRGLTADLRRSYRSDLTTECAEPTSKTDQSTVDTVLLAGGSTRMPMVREMLAIVLRQVRPRPTSTPTRPWPRGRAHRPPSKRPSSPAKRVARSTSAPTTSPPTAWAWSSTASSAAQLEDHPATRASPPRRRAGQLLDHPRRPDHHGPLAGPGRGRRSARVHRARPLRVLRHPRRGPRAEAGCRSPTATTATASSRSRPWT